jgi:hypothetical protein
MKARISDAEINYKIRYVCACACVQDAKKLVQYLVLLQPGIEAAVAKEKEKLQRLKNR